MEIDYASFATALTAQVGDAVTGALPVAGVILGVYVGWSIFRSLIGR